MSQLQNYDFRSEEVKEILGTPPSWIVRWGTFAVIGGLFLLMALTYFIKFPDKIKGDFELNAKGDIYEVNAPTDSYLDDIFVPDSVKVEKNEPVAILKNGYLYTDYLLLKKQIDTLESINLDKIVEFYPKENLPDLGPFERAYKDVYQSYDQLHKSVVSDRTLNKKGDLEVYLSLLKRELNDLKGRRVRDSKLLDRRANTLRNYRLRQKKGEDIEDKVNEASNDYLEAANKLGETEGGLRRVRAKIEQTTASINSLKKIGKEVDLTYWENFQQELQKLKDAVEEWENTYIIYAPIAGKVIQYGESWTKNTFYKKGEPIVGIIRPESDNATSQEYFVVEVQIGLDGYGKVKEGQEVILKLDEYPFRQFGVLRGDVIEKSTFKINQSYTVKVRIPSDLKTTFSEQITPANQMIGRAEIITEDQRFIERILNRFMSIFKNR